MIRFGLDRETDRSASRLTGASARRWRRRVIAVPASALLIAVVAGSAIALAESSSHALHHSTPPSTPIVESTPSVAAVDPSIASSLASVFGRAQQTSDIPPSDIIDHALKSEGANPQLARLAGDFSGQQVYLVPDKGGVCLASSDLLAQGCFAASDVAAGQAGETIACYPFMAGNQQEQFGILPGASDLAATYSDGSVRPVQLSGEVFVLNAVPSTSPYPVKISWVDATGQRQTEPTSISPNLGVPNPCPQTTESPLGGTPAQQIAIAKERIAQSLQ